MQDTEQIVMKLHERLGGLVGRAFLEAFCRIAKAELDCGWVLVGYWPPGAGEVMPVAAEPQVPPGLLSLIEKGGCEAALSGLGISSVRRYPLKDPQGRSAGVVVLVDRVPPPEGSAERAVVDQLAPRLIAELTRVQADCEPYEQALRASEEMRQLAFDAAGLIACEFDLRTHEMRWTGDVHRLFGLAPEQEAPTLAGWEALVSPEDKPHIKELFQQALAADQSYSVRYRIKTPDGEVRWILSRGRAVHDAGGEPTRIYAVLVDVSEETRLLSQLHHAQRLNALGELAAGISHEINNPLTVMSGALWRLQRLLDEEEPDRAEVRSLVGYVQEHLQRTSKLVQSVKTMARRDPGHPEVFDMQEVVADAVQFLAPVYRSEGIEVESTAAACLAPITGYRSRLMQVLLNLLANARDAVEQATAKQIKVRLERFGGDVEVQVTDSGAGMGESQLRHIFEPYYTTKPAGKGLGLGLSICQSIVTEMRGRIQVESQPGHGTTFRVILPAAGG